MGSRFAMIVVLFAASAVVAQTATTPTPAQDAQTGVTTPTTGQHQPQAKSADEYTAYNAAAAKTDAAQLEAAADEFAQKFPVSELKELLYVRAMNMYQQQNNTGK